jgi:hypothetical protein
MNTEQPCASCKHCGFDAMTEDDPTTSAYCKLEWGDNLFAEAQASGDCKWQTRLIATAQKGQGE